MKKVYLLLSIMVLGFGVASAQVNVTGTVLGTTMVTYANLTTAFAAVNSGAHTGAITIEITASTTEPGVARLNRGDVLPAAYTSVDINVTNDNIVVEGSATAVVELRGADNVTLDGDNGSTAGVNRNLTIRNTSTGGNNVGLWITSATAGGANGANGNYITNCIIEGVSNLQTSFGIVSGGSGVTVGVPTAFPNNNNRLINNLVRQCNTGIAIIGNNGTDNNWLISNNTIGSMVPAEIVGAHGISAVNVSNLQISGNTIKGLQADVTQVVTGIDLGQAAVNTQIFNNRIHDIQNLEQTTGYGSTGIYLGLTTSNNNRIFNNQIHSVHSYGHAPADPVTADNNSYGIAIVTDDGYAVYHNTVYMNVAPVNIIGGNSAALYIGSGVTPNSINLRNNILSNTIQAPGAHYSVYSGTGAVFVASDYNLYNAPGDLCYMAAPAATLADWKTLTLDDKGSVSGNIALTLIGDAVQVDATNPNSWLANGRAIVIAGPNYTADINSTPRATLTGYPNDMGAAEYTPDTTLVPPPFAIASAAPALNTITTYSVGNRKVAEIRWGSVGTVPTTVNVQYYSGLEPPLYLTTDERIASFFNISQIGGSGFDAELKFYYTYAENRGVPDAALQVVKDTVGNGSWSNFGGLASTDADGRFVEWSAISSTFGKFTLGNHPLGLDLLTFTGKNIGTANEVAWTTASEDHMNNFEVMRSEDGINFKVIGSVKATNKAIGNQYKFRDEKPAVGSNYYKLKITDLNDYSTYSDIVAVRSGAVTNIDITSLYPNPATSTISVALNSVGDNAVKVQVTDISGKAMITQNSAVVAGSNEVKLDVSELASGIYIIKATLADGTVSVQKFVKQ